MSIIKAKAGKYCTQEHETTWASINMKRLAEYYNRGRENAWANTTGTKLSGIANKNMRVTLQ